MSVQLKRISQSFYFSKFGTSDSGSAILSKLGNLDITKYEVSDSSKAFLIGLVDRKVSSDMKAEILKLVDEDVIKITLLDKSCGYPMFLNSLPISVGNKPIYLANIGYYAKFDLTTREVKDVDPRILFSILVSTYAIYKINTNLGRLMNDLKFQDVIVQAYKKLFNRAISKIVSLNTLTADEKFNYEVVLTAFIAKRMLLKNDNGAITYTRSLFTKPNINKDKLETVIKMIDINKIEGLSDLVDEIKHICPSFSKLNAVQLMKEWLISLKMPSVLAIDLIHFFVPMLASVFVGSSGIYNDNAIVSTLNSRELDIIKLLLVRI